MGWFSLGVTVAVCLVMMAFVVLKPAFSVRFRQRKISIESFWVIALAAPLILLVSGAVTPPEVWKGMTGGGSINPLKILVLFLSMCLMSAALDKAGFFSYCALKVWHRCGRSQFKLFFALYALISLLTVFTSNDVIILAFTPFIYYFSKNAGINPLPYVVSLFVAANTWSLVLIVGNPTNIYIAASAGITFTEYFKVMAVPAVACGLSALAVLLLMFFRMLKAPVALPDENAEKPKLKDKPVTLTALTALGLCVAGLAVSSYIKVEMWAVSAGFALALILFLIILAAVRRAGSKGRTGNAAAEPAEYTAPAEIARLSETFKALPYSVIPFLLAMFTAVLALEKHGITASFSAALGQAASGGGNAGNAFLYGYLSALASNIVNNIPMSVLFSGILEAGGSNPAAVYATVIGSNTGAFFTPVGALAGMMFLKILKEKGSGFRIRDFFVYCAPVAAVSIAAACGALLLFL